MGEKGEYDQALGFLYNARKMTKAVLFSGHRTLSWPLFYIILDQSSV